MAYKIIWDRWADPVEQTIYFMDGYIAFRDSGFDGDGNPSIANPYQEGDLRHEYWQYGFDNSHDDDTDEDYNDSIDDGD